MQPAQKLCVQHGKSMTCSRAGPRQRNGILCMRGRGACCPSGPHQRAGWAATAKGRACGLPHCRRAGVPAAHLPPWLKRAQADGTDACGARRPRRAAADPARPCHWVRPDRQGCHCRLHLRRTPRCSRRICTQQRCTIVRGAWKNRRLRGGAAALFSSAQARSLQRRPPSHKKPPRATPPIGPSSSNAAASSWRSSGLRSRRSSRSATLNPSSNSSPPLAPPLPGPARRRRLCIAGANQWDKRQDQIVKCMQRHHENAGLDQQPGVQAGGRRLPSGSGQAGGRAAGRPASRQAGAPPAIAGPVEGWGRRQCTPSPGTTQETRQEEGRRGWEPRELART